MSSATLETGLQFMQLGSNLVATTLSENAGFMQDADLEAVIRTSNQVLDCLALLFEDALKLDDEQVFSTKDVLPANPFATDNPFSSLEQVLHTLGKTEHLAAVIALENKVMRINDLSKALVQRLERLSEEETAAVSRDHPDILERVERYEREGSQGRPWREIRAEQRAKRGQ